MSPRPAQTALRWVSDREPGIQRRRRGSAFAYLDADGRPLRDPQQLARIRSLAIPPAYERVWICARDDGHLQATARDARGRKQYRYHPLWRAVREQHKFDHLLEFGLALPRLRAAVQRELSVPDQPTRTRVLAAVVCLLDATCLRIGNAEYARSNGSYGLSTLRARHVRLRGPALTLAFVGKSGVRHKVEISDPRLARVVRSCRELPGQELFRYLDDAGGVHVLGSGDVNAWLAEVAGTRVTAKDFRTWHASVHALDLILAGCAVDAAPSRPTDVVVAVSHRLGNSAAVCRKAYIHPAVIALGDALADPARRAQLLARPWAGRAPTVRGLATPERRMLALLRDLANG
ncbi:MAG TPA: DNA topoisomerase IB [Burkholderiaceae bacterium]